MLFLLGGYYLFSSCLVFASFQSLISFSFVGVHYAGLYQYRMQVPFLWFFKSKHWISLYIIQPYTSSFILVLVFVYKIRETPVITSTIKKVRKRRVPVKIFVVLKSLIAKIIFVTSYQVIRVFCFAPGIAMFPGFTAQKQNNEQKKPCWFKW